MLVNALIGLLETGSLGHRTGGQRQGQQPPPPQQQLPHPAPPHMCEAEAAVLSFVAALVCAGRVSVRPSLALRLLGFLAAASAQLPTRRPPAQLAGQATPAATDAAGAATGATGMAAAAAAGAGASEAGAAAAGSMDWPSLEEAHTSRLEEQVLQLIRAVGVNRLKADRQDPDRWSWQVSSSKGKVLGRCCWGEGPWFVLCV